MLHKLTSGRYVSDDLLKGVLGVAAEYGTEPTKCEVESMRHTTADWVQVNPPRKAPPRPGLLRIIANPGVTFEYDHYEDAVRDMDDVLRLCGVNKPSGTVFRVWLNKDPTTLTEVVANSPAEANDKFCRLHNIIGLRPDGCVAYGNPSIVVVKPASEAVA